jgi:hypothetical protein
MSIDEDIDFDRFAMNQDIHFDSVLGIFPVL